MKAQDFHKPKLCKARIHLNNPLWETDLKICPEPDHNMVACSASSRTAGWASGCTFLTPFSHLHRQPYKTSVSAWPKQASLILWRRQLIPALQVASTGSLEPPRDYWMWSRFPYYGNPTLNLWTHECFRVCFLFHYFFLLMQVVPGTV